MIFKKKKREAERPPSLDLLGYNQADFTPEVITKILIQVYNEEKGAEYAASSLAVKIPVLETPEPVLVFINLNTCRTDEEKLWCAMCYMKYKGSPTGSKYEHAINCILEYAEKYDQQTEAAKMMLLNGEIN